MQHYTMHPTSRARSGVTLTEVLMSMFIMAIGVIFVATLFPAAVLRSIQASQMTSATIARYNAEALIDTVSDIVHDPDGDGNRAEHFQINDPSQRLTRNYIVDPYGFYTHQQDGSATPDSIHAWFGCKARASDGEVLTVLPLLRRFGGLIGVADAEVTGDFLNNRAEAAAQLTFANDRWERKVDVIEGDYIPIESTTGAHWVGIQFPTKTITEVVPRISRVRVFDEFGRRSQTYSVTAVDTAQREVYWDDPAANPPGRILPATFLPDDTTGLGGPSRIVVENNQRLFNWFLTVRKETDGRANIDVVVTSSRRVAPENEHAYDAIFSPGSSVVLVNSGATDTDPAPEPFLKRGGYVFDVANARWYRIQSFENVTTTIRFPANSTTDRTFDIRLEIENEVRAPGTNRNLDGDGGGTFDGFAVFMPGIVDVFPLSTRALPELSE